MMRAQDVGRAAAWLLEEVRELYADEPQTGSDAWWQGSCDSVLATIEEDGLLERYDARPVWWGGFRCVEGDVAGHCWLVIGDVIVDPTARQFGAGQPRVVRPGDSWYAHYLERT